VSFLFCHFKLHVMKTTVALSLLLSMSTAFAADEIRSNGKVRNGKVIYIGTRLERIEPLLLNGSERFFSARLPTDFLPPSSDAEPMNIRAMQQYQQKWESYRTTPQMSPMPTLYPSRVEQILTGNK
jgi:hypothetical protein